MYYLIQGRRYDPAKLAELDLNTLREMKSHTGLTVGELATLLDEHLSKGATMAEILSDDAALLAFSVLVWMSKRAASEQVTMEEACRFSPMTEFQVVQEPGDPQLAEAPDPRSARSPRKSPADRLTGRKAAKAPASGRSATSKRASKSA